MISCYGREENGRLPCRLHAPLVSVPARNGLELLRLWSLPYSFLATGVVLIHPDSRRLGEGGGERWSEQGQGGSVGDLC